MRYIVVLKYGEIVLKGLNRSRFESLLMRRVKNMLKNVNGGFELYNSQSTLIIRGNDSADMREVAEKMKRFSASVMLRLRVRKGHGGNKGRRPGKAKELSDKPNLHVLSGRTNFPIFPNLRHLRWRGA